jgi:uncharacterized protein (DUF952 family)
MSRLSALIGIRSVKERMLRYAGSMECREKGVTYHLVPSVVWDRQSDAPTYLPEDYERDGFIHCTNGLDELVAVGNRYYKADQRQFRVLILDVSKVESPVRYDDPGEIFPHIYGPLNTNSIVGLLLARRNEDGTFVSYTRE